MIGISASLFVLQSTVNFKLIRRVENIESPFYRITHVSKAGDAVGEQGYTSLHDGWTAPVYLRKGKISKTRIETKPCSLPKSTHFDRTDPLFKKYPTGGPTDCTWPVGGKRFDLKSGVKLCQLVYEGGQQEFEQVIVQYPNGKAAQLNQVVPGLKGFVTRSLIHIDKSGWILVGGYRGSFYGDESYVLGSMGEQLYWISYR